MNHVSFHRKVLLVNLARRQASNPAYSMRAFARDLELSPTSVSLILSGKQRLSLKMAKVIANKLALSVDETEEFLKSVAEVKHSSKTKISHNSRKPALFVEQNESHLLENWLNIPIMEFVKSRRKVTIDQICDVFALGKSAAKIQLKSMREQGFLIEKSGQWEAVRKYLSFGGKAPSPTIREFHQETLKRASRALEEQSFETRMVSSTIFAIDPKKRAAAFEMLERFRKEFCVEYSVENQGSSEIYCLGLQFFRAHMEEK